MKRRLLVSDRFSKDLDTALEAAQTAGTIISQNFELARAAEVKSDNRGLVTETDQAAEQAILQTLRSHSPYSILSEESGDSPGTSELRWIVDPLDGTTNFFRGLPLFAVSIALSRGSEIILGVIHNPVNQDYFYAERGKGAYLNDQSLRVSSTAAPGTAVMFVNHGYDIADKQRFSIASERLVAHAYLRRLGTTALELCFLAKGSVDAFVCSGDELWDFAAGLIIVEEAGGKITDWQGNDWDGKSSYVLASNDKIHGFLVEQLRNLQT